MKTRLKQCFIVLIGFSMLLVFCTDSYACTAWAAAGNRTSSGGVLIAKNTDGLPHDSVLEIIVPKSGLTYLGLFHVKGSFYKGPVAGINEKGLSVASLDADGVQKSKMHRGKKNLNESILSGYESVSAVLENELIFSKSLPGFYLIADKTKIALIEIAPDKEISVAVAENGVLYHTNHYIHEKLLRANRVIEGSSEARLERIRQLLQGRTAPFTIEDFMAFSEDKEGEPIDSIWTTGVSSKKKRTLASWIVSIPKEGCPELYVKTAAPDGSENVYNMLLDTSFWKEGLE